MNSAFIGLLLAVSATVGFDANHRPRFFIDGEACLPRIENCGHPSGGKINYESMCGYIRRSTAAYGHSLLNIGIDDNDYRRADGTYDWSLLDERAARYLEADPEAKFMIGIRFVGAKWAELHPDEQVRYACRPLVLGSLDEYAGDPVRPSSASKLFRAEIFRDLAALAEHVRSASWGKRVIAVRPCYGCSTEWFSYGTLAFPDCGQAMTRYFREWLRAHYKDDAGLCAAWHKENVSIDTATIPTRKEQAPNAFFLDPVRNRPAIDFNRASADSMADLLIAVGTEIKCLLPGRIVGAYYGYVFEALPASCAIALPDRVLASGAVDFFSNPPPYCKDVRHPGGDYGQKLVAATLYRHGKFSIVEDDSRLHAMTNWAPKGWCMADARADRAILRRNVLNTFFDRGGYQICDPGAGHGDRDKGRPHTFDNSVALGALHESWAVLNGIQAVPKESTADMALIVTPSDKFFTHTQYFQGEADERNPFLDAQWDVWRGVPLWLHRSGAVFDILTLEDLLASKKTYRTLVFQTAYAMGTTHRQAVMQLTRRPGTTAVWFVAPGSVTKDGFSDDAMSELVGMSLSGSGAVPHVVSTDRSARQIEACGGWCKDLPGKARAFFFPNVPRTAVEAGALVDAIGEHRYVRGDAYVRRLGDYVMVHVGKAGRYELKLPQENLMVRELFTRRTFAAAPFLLACDGPQTWLFEIVPTKRPFGALTDGRETHLWRLASPDGLVLDFTDYGGRLVRALAPDRQGNLADVAVGFNSAGEYERYGFCVGTLIGRYGNRIADGRFTQDGRIVQLGVNENANGRHCNLHGGPAGWDTKIWSARRFSEGDVQGLAFSLVSPDGDMGFPGCVKATVTYRVLPGNVWRIDYEATTDKPTVINLTHHSYWNLAGEASGHVLDQELTIFADRYSQTTPGLIPTCDVPVVGTGFDFTSPRAIRHAWAWMEAQTCLAPMGNWYDHNFVLRGTCGVMHPAAKMRDPVSGRTLEIFTTEPCLQMYGAQDFSDKLPTKTPGKRQVAFGGVALETQHYPNSPNRPDYPSTVLRPGETFRSTTEYRFGIE